MSYSVCGIDCNACKFKGDKKCEGCYAIQGKVFWGQCELYTCCKDRDLIHCGKCNEFPCDKLQQWATSENPERIDNLRSLSSDT